MDQAAVDPVVAGSSPVALVNWPGFQAGPFRLEVTKFAENQGTFREEYRHCPEVPGTVCALHISMERKRRQYHAREEKARVLRNG